MVSPLLLLALPLASSLSNFPIVTTSYGAVRGYEYRARNGFTGEIFKKIPFASPPIGPRRWKKPIPPEKWNYTVDGTFFGPGCAQRSSFWKGYVTGFSEDCLNLNIYTSKECRESTSLCPVVLYIHGGVALFDGTQMFRDEELITNFASQGVIMVTVDYRLGVFGVMALGDENVLPANLAVHDVLEALRFTRQEIHNFGGDKDQISIMGHSTGATMVQVMTFSPGINKPGEPPLFARAIAMSGEILLETEERQVERSHRVARNLGCTGSAQEIVDCLLPLNTEAILSVAFKTGGLNPFSKTQINDLTMAGELLPFTSARVLRENQKTTHIMFGSTLKEMDYYGFNGVDYKEDVRTNINRIFGIRNNEECMNKYFDDERSGKFVPEYSGESQAMFLSNWILADAQTKAGGEAYLYQYDYPAHALHTDDVSYVMGFHDHPEDMNEKWLSHVFPIYFANFIKGLPPAPDWKPFVPELMNYYSVNKSFADGVSPETKEGYHRALNEYYAKMIEYDDNLTNIKKKFLNVPIQYKELIVLSTEPVNIRDILFYSIILGIILFLVYKFYQCWRSRQRSGEESPLLIDRLNNNG